MRRMQCDCTWNPGQIMALMHRLHYMLNMVMCILQYVNLATHCWGLLNHIFLDKLSMTCPMPFYGIKQIDSSNKFHIYIEVQTSVTHSTVPCVLFFFVLIPHFNIICGLLDQCQYLNNCTPTPPLIQPQSTDNKLGLMLG